jgi:hypothetical protein
VVDKDEKMQDAFLCGLNPQLKTIIGAMVYPNFNTMVNKAITTKKHKKEEIKDNKRKFEGKKMFHQEKVQKTQHPTHFGQKSQSAVSYRVPTASFRQPSQSTRAKTQGTYHTQSTGGSQLTNPKACFNYRETGHFIANCPYKNKPASSIFSNSVNGPRQMSGANCGHQRRLNSCMERPKRTMFTPRKLRMPQD